MIVKNDDRFAVANYRIEQAKQAITDVEILIKNNQLAIAANRIYYGMF